jgi:hypothetical protein
MLILTSCDQPMVLKTSSPDRIIYLEIRMVSLELMGFGRRAGPFQEAVKYSPES